MVMEMTMRGVYARGNQQGPLHQEEKVGTTRQDRNEKLLSLAFGLHWHCERFRPWMHLPGPVELQLKVKFRAVGKLGPGSSS